MTHATLTIHAAGGEKVSLPQIASIKLPESTRSYRPVPFASAVDAVQTLAKGNGWELLREDYGINRGGLQQFGVMTFAGDEEKGLAIGLRQSYDKSLALGVAVGASVFVCDNLAFRGSDVRVVRKNTANVWGDFRALVTERLGRAREAFADLSATVNRLRGAPCDQDMGYRFLGLARGRGMLTPTQASEAFRAWDLPPQEDFRPRTAWSLLNAITEALKHGDAGGMIDRQTNAMALVEETFTS